MKKFKKGELKRGIEKTAKTTGELISNKTADKITSTSKSPNELRSGGLRSKEINPIEEANNELPKESYISPEIRQQIIDEL